MSKLVSFAVILVLALSVHIRNSSKYFKTITIFPVLHSPPSFLLLSPTILF